MESRSIKSKLIQSHLITTFIVLSVCSCAFILNDLFIFKRAVEKTLRTNAKLISRDLDHALKSGNREEAEQILLMLRAEPAITSARVTDKNGNLFATFDFGSDEVPITGKDFIQQDSQFKGGYFILSHPIGDSFEPRGYLFLKANLKVFFRGYLTYIWIVLGVFCTGLFVTACLSNLLHGSVSNPIIALADMAKSVSQSGDYSLRAKLNRAAMRIEEVKILSDEFNHMLQKVQTVNEELERKVAERTKEIQDAQQKLVDSSKMSALGMMAGGVAHEINTPLTTLNLNIDLIDETLNFAPEDIATLRETNEVNRKITTRIAKIVRGMKNFCRDGSHDPMVPKPVASIVKDTISLCEEKLKHHDVELQIDELPPMDCQVNCRAVEIEQVLLNLINNAHDAVREMHNPWIRISCEFSGGMLLLSVTDSGHGIDEKTRKRLFEPFFTTKGVGKGTGLGLSISIGIANAHGGNLAYDETSKNTRFVITLPLHSEESKAAA